MSVQTAINATNDGDTVYVQSGTYYENVNVNKRLILRGINVTSNNNTLIGNNATSDYHFGISGGANVTATALKTDFESANRILTHMCSVKRSY